MENQQTSSDITKLGFVSKSSKSWNSLPAHLKLETKLLKFKIGPSGVRALPVAAGINVVAIVLGIIFGPSGVSALPVTAGTNEGGHYFCYFFTSSSSWAHGYSNLIMGCHRISNFCMGS